MKQLKWARAPATLKEDAEGTVQAVFSTFNTVDSDGDVVRAEAFTDGQQVPMVWAHNWEQPVGKGTIRLDPDRAVFEGGFFMDTQAGQEAFKTVRNMGDLQEWSWGFRILDASPGEFDGQSVRFIEKAEVFEVSPVLVGANRETHTLSVKAALAELERDIKEGRRNSTADMSRLRQIQELLAELIGEMEAEQEPDDAGKQADDGEWKESARKRLALATADFEIAERLAIDIT